MNHRITYKAFGLSGSRPSITFWHESLRFFSLLRERTIRGRGSSVFFLNTTNVEHALSVIEISLVSAEAVQQQKQFLFFNMTVNDAVKELNVRFSEHGIGYQFESSRIVKVDSQFLHQEVVKPALQILKAKHYSGANDEFRKAHEHYRHQRYSEAVNECLKALESTLKVICKKREWPFSADKDTAKKTS